MHRISASRRKPIGWRGQSYRHYLAAKGISTGRYRSASNGSLATGSVSKMGGRGYFARDELKGNRGFPELKAAYQDSLTDQEILLRRNENDYFRSLAEQVQAKNELKKQRRQFPELQSIQEGGAVIPNSLQGFSPAQLQTAPVPEEQLPPVDMSIPTEVPVRQVTNVPAYDELANVDLDEVPLNRVVETQDQVTTEGVPPNPTASFNVMGIQ